LQNGQRDNTIKHTEEIPTKTAVIIRKIRESSQTTHAIPKMQPLIKASEEIVILVRIFIHFSLNSMDNTVIFRDIQYFVSLAHGLQLPSMFHFLNLLKQIQLRN